MKSFPLSAGMAALILAAAAAAQGYDPRETFAPRDAGQAVNTYRSANGLPGPDYWQNRADYAIHATLDPTASRPALTASEDITYTNNSPDTLAVLWLQLDQNLYRPESRSRYAGSGSPRPGFTAGAATLSTEGFEVDDVEVEGAGGFTRVHTLVSDTRLRIDLPAPLGPRGARIRVRIRYHFAIPPAELGGRMGWSRSKDGPIYDLAQWYPRMAVYDDIRGWDSLPYLAQEFYLEYGDFDYWVTAPADLLLAGSGELMNPQEVLTATQRARLASARDSDATVMIRSPAEVHDAASRPQHGPRTWHFHMAHARDVAFTASAAFVWDAARIRLPDGRTALAESVYPRESAGDARWGRSTQYIKDAVENFSRRWYPYPWPAAINVAGPAAGMEYPGIVFNGIEDAGKALFAISAHEIGHSWFPMIVGFDERRDPWMDEGFNTFIDVYESEDFNHGEYAPKRDAEYAPGGGNPVDEIVPLLEDPQAPPILGRGDTMTRKYQHPVYYFKSALGLKLLREQILGPDRFDPAFRRFIAAWAYKHPKPADFFRAMESEGGEDLSWWWRGWYDHNWTLDLAVAKIAPVDGNPARGTAITVASLDRLILPATLRVEFTDGTHQDYRLPAESFIQHADAVVTVAPGRTVAAATIDPDHSIPDKDRSNNRLAVASGQDPDK